MVPGNNLDKPTASMPNYCPRTLGGKCASIHKGETVNLEQERRTECRPRGGRQPATDLWQSLSSSWPMNAAACRSRCRPLLLRRSCVPVSCTPDTTSFPCVPRSGLGGISRRKVKLEPFLIFNQQFLTLIRAGLPILGSLQMLAKIQKSAHFRSQLDDVTNRVKTGEAALRGVRGADRRSGDVHDDTAGGRALGQPAGSAGTLRRIPEGFAHLPQKTDRVAYISLRCC